VVVYRLVVLSVQGEGQRGQIERLAVVDFPATFSFVSIGR